MTTENLLFLGILAATAVSMAAGLSALGAETNVRAAAAAKSSGATMPALGEGAPESGLHPCNSMPDLPSPPAGVTDVRFQRFYKPIGARGLEYTDELKQLAGKKVRLLGYMVKQEVPLKGLFLLCSRPVTLEEDEMGLADDLPASVVHVHEPEGSTSAKFIPGPLVVIGTLELGPSEEADGRLSSIRLRLDRPVAPLAENVDRYRSNVIAGTVTVGPQTKTNQFAEKGIIQ